MCVMYVCMYVRTYVCMYIYVMYVCMYVPTYVCMYIYVMYVCMQVERCVCVYIYICIYLFIMYCRYIHICMCAFKCNLQQDTCVCVCVHTLLNILALYGNSAQFTCLPAFLPQMIILCLLLLIQLHIRFARIYFILFSNFAFVYTLIDMNTTLAFLFK